MDLAKIEEYMKENISDPAHDEEHMYRVLFLAKDIASYEKNVDMDVLTVACLLHDIGRKYSGNHAAIGADMAYEWLTANGYPLRFSSHVSDCIRAHSFRNASASDRTSVEAKILYDADKLDCLGAMGIARALAYAGGIGVPIYRRDEDGNVSDKIGPSVIHEYRKKLKKLHKTLHTRRAGELGEARRAVMKGYVKTLIKELQ